MDIIEALKEYQDLLNPSGIDRLLGTPMGTTARILRGELYRNFTDEQLEQLRKTFKSFAKKIIK